MRLCGISLCNGRGCCAETYILMIWEIPPRNRCDDWDTGYVVEGTRIPLHKTVAWLDLSYEMELVISLTFFGTMIDTLKNHENFD